MTTLCELLEIKVEVTQDEELGTMYVATNDDIGLVTDGSTFEALLVNLREALALCLEDAAELNIVPQPRVIMVVDVTFQVTAKPEVVTAQQVVAHLRTAGVLMDVSTDEDTEELSLAERHHIGKLFAGERPTEDLIDEDRGLY